MCSLLLILRAAALLPMPVALGFLGGPVQGRWQPPRETTKVQEQIMGQDGVSPAPTSPPELAPMELFRRQDYLLPDDYCGWFDDVKCRLHLTFLAGWDVLFC
jgi:hypothetical protein